MLMIPVCSPRQAFMAGANAIFTGEQMLTTPCSGWDQDKAMLQRWGMRGLKSFEDAEAAPLAAEAAQAERTATAV